ncbi:DUF4150 domain-containing protein [Pseudenhygromyxa sp. WMMC2535]|uniref:DUF4150 domain-containing protein n=1 Tax=Pseudenhygromyxa sp. WMMC2535 TaxID=2712867 RepID=UPI0020D0F60A|nr:DUF4150 domain-containing protein [Pseudenhygromyxa sp. WMMC2535]
MPTVFANGRSILHKGDGGVQTCPIPDVCKTPSPGGPVPIPYVNVAKDSDLAKGAKQVTCDGEMPAIKGAELCMSAGDEAGSAGGGVVSSKIKGKLTWAMCSTDVKFEAKGVIRFLEICLHNGNNSNTGGNAALGTPSPGLAYGDDSDCPLCGKQGGHPLPAVKEGKKRADSQNKAKVAYSHSPEERNGRGYMIGVLMAQDKQGRRRTLRACSGRPPTGFLPIPEPQPSPVGQPMRTVGGRKVVFRPAPTDSTAPGNCAAPKLIQAAIAEGLTPLSMTEFWRGPKAGPYSDGNHAASCTTCQRILPALLCPEPPNSSNPDQIHYVD